MFECLIPIPKGQHRREETCLENVVLADYECFSFQYELNQFWGSKKWEPMFPVGFGSPTSVLRCPLIKKTPEAPVTKQRWKNDGCGLEKWGINSQIVMLVGK